MATRKYLLSATDFKKLTPVHRNVDDELIKQSIISCQDMFIQPLIGTGIYNDIKGELPSSLTSANQTLLEDYIHNAMLYWIMCDIVRPTTYQMSNMGVQTRDGDNMQPADQEEIRRLENNYFNKAKFYANRLVKYLKENKSTFPLYDNPGTGYDIIHPTGRPYRTSIYLGGNKGKKHLGLDIYMGDEWCE
jgi:hypothetical protein